MKITIDGQPATFTIDRAHGFGLTYAWPTRHLPRLTIRRDHHLWQATWTAQNRSFISTSERRLHTAIIATIRNARHHHWPLIIWKIR